MSSEAVKVLEFAKQGEFEEVKRILATIRHQPIQSWKDDLALKNLRSHLDKGVLYYVLSSSDTDEDIECLLDVLKAGADPFMARVAGRKCCFVVIGDEKHDPVHLAAASGKGTCLGELLKFDYLPPAKKRSWVRARTRTLKLCKKNRQFDLSCLIECVLSMTEPKPLVKFAAEKEWIVVFNQLRRGCVQFEDLAKLWEGKNVYEWALTHGNIPLARELEYRHPFILVELETRRQPSPYVSIKSPSPTDLPKFRSASNLSGEESPSGNADANDAEDDSVLEDYVGAAGDAGPNPLSCVGGTNASLNNVYDEDEDAKSDLVFGDVRVREEDLEEVDLSSSDSPTLGMNDLNAPARA